MKYEAGIPLLQWTPVGDWTKLAPEYREKAWLADAALLVSKAEGVKSPKIIYYEIILRSVQFGSGAPCTSWTSKDGRLEWGYITPWHLTDALDLRRLREVDLRLFLYSHTLSDRLREQLRLQFGITEIPT